MQRSVKYSESPSPSEDDIYGASPGPSRPRTARRTSNADPSMSPSPAVSISSDKENRSARPLDKGKGRAPMGPPQPPSEAAGINKRRKIERDEDESRPRNRRRKTVEVDEDDAEIAGYDPEQDIEERREIRLGLRSLNRNLLENRTEVLNPNSKVLKETLLQADGYADRLKQTSDATIDSRLLVATADLSLKKTVALVSGNTSQGVDVDEFISKCMSYMRRAEGAEDDRARVAQAPRSTQRRSGRQSNAVNDEDGEDDGEMLNWEHLGRFACLPNNSRPSVPGFLLGPLSAEGRAKRPATARRAALKVNDLQQSRPEVLQAGDIHRDENSNLTNLCTQISTRLEKVRDDAVQAIESVDNSDFSDEQDQQLLDDHGVSPEGGMALFKFVINPRSFGQTIENIFYVSFLIRDGKAGLYTDERGMPYLKPTTPRTTEERAKDGGLRYQSVIALDYAQWEELIELFDIQEPMIKHREEEEHRNVGTKGWYA